MAWSVDRGCAGFVAMRRTFGNKTVALGQRIENRTRGSCNNAQFSRKLGFTCGRMALSVLSTSLKIPGASSATRRSNCAFRRSRT